MNKRSWIIFVVLPLLITWFLDQITKVAATDIVGLKFYGIFGLVLHHNPGAILGLFSDLPAVLRVVSLSTGGAFLIFTFIILQYLIPSRSLVLRSGMSILLGGILGNVTDRIVYGYVIDFLVIGNMRWTTPAFNVADALQWVGYFMIVYGIIKDGKLLWPDKNSRKSFMINPRFQLRYCTKLVLFGFAFALIAGTYSYTFLKVTLEDVTPHYNPHFLSSFITTFIIISLTFIIILFLTGMVLSHRAAGPIYAFEKYLEDLIKGKPRRFKLRNLDEFKHLEELANKISSQWNDKNKS